VIVVVDVLQDKIDDDTVYAIAQRDAPVLRAECAALVEQGETNKRIVGVTLST